MHATKQIKIISLVFFLSGCSALIFETVWFRIASTVLGSSIWSAAAVLMAFMAGLGIGNIAIAWHGRKLDRPIGFYIILELMIGMTGLLSVFLLPLLSPIIIRLAADIINDSGVLNLTRFSFAFIVFLIPAVAMGATLPVLQKVLYLQDRSFARSFARLYGWNTFGAVIGTLIAELLLITYIGIKGTAFIAGLLNLSAALILLSAFKNKTVKYVPEKSPIAKFKLFENIRYLIAPFLTGLILLALEVIWFRYMILVKDGTSAIFAIMLAIVLTGIGLGGFIATRLTYRHYNIDKTIEYLLFFAALTVIAGFYINNQLVAYLSAEIAASRFYFSLTAIVLMLPTSIITGMLLPLLAEKLFTQLPETTRASGIITFMNTIGAAIGSGLATFVLLPLLGMETSLFVLAIAYLIVMLIYSFEIDKKETLVARLAPPAIGIIAIIFLFPFGTLDRFYVKLSKNLFPDEELVIVKEGLNETLRYYKKEQFGQPLRFTLVTNSHSMSATRFSAIRYMKLYAYFPYIMNNNLKDVLQISYGVGNTAEAITRIRTVENIDIVDVSKDILNLSSIIHNDTKWFPQKDERVNIHIEDGRFYLQTTNKKYDLITGEPPPPKMSGIVNLYSEEYFKLLKSRLNPGGISTYWLPVHSLHEGDTLAIISAFCSAFSDCSLWNGYGLDFMLIGSNGGLKPVSASRLNKIWNSYLADELISIGLERPAQLGALFLADNKSLSKLTENTLPVTDNFPHRISASTSNFEINSDVNFFLLDIKRRKTEFSQSTYIQELFPEELMNEINSDFKVEAMITRAAFFESPVREFTFWNDLFFLITKTNLKIAPLLYLNSSPKEQAIISMVKNNNSANFRLKKAEGLLAARDYHSAYVLLETNINSKDIRSVPLYELQLFYFLKALDLNLSTAELKNVTPRLTPEKEYADWYEYTEWLIQMFQQSTKRSR